MKRNLSKEKKWNVTEREMKEQTTPVGKKGREENRKGRKWQ